MAKSVWLQELKWTDVRDYLAQDDRIVMPVGSTEQHGPWLPVGTDTYAAISLAEDAAAKTGVLAAPPIWTGWTPHHMALPGTISIRAEVLIELLSDAVKSLAAHGFKAFILLNGHRIVNLPWMQIAAERARRELGVQAVLFDPAYMSREIVDRLEFGPVGHAEEIEGSQMLFRYPDLVDQAAARDYLPPEAELYHVDPRHPGDTLCYVPGTAAANRQAAEQSGGTAGRPSQASAEKGRAYHEHLVSRLVQVLESLKRK